MEVPFGHCRGSWSRSPYSKTPASARQPSLQKCDTTHLATEGCMASTSNLPTDQTHICKSKTSSWTVLVETMLDKAVKLSNFNT